MELINPQFDNLIAIIAISIGLVISIWFVIGLYGMRARNDEDNQPVEGLHNGKHESGTGVPVALKIFYIFIALSLVLYVLYIKIGGISY